MVQLYKTTVLVQVVVRMSQSTNDALKDLSVVHRLCFATRSLPAGSPYYWENVARFSIEGKNNYSLSGDEARVFVQNLQVFNPNVFDSDFKLTKELVKTTKGDSPGSDKVGIILRYPVELCVICNSKLCIRQDRSVQATVYDEKLGTMPAIHYTRYCRKKGCSLQQHYGYYTKSDTSEVMYNNDALSLSYFMCSRETAFSIEILKKFDMECLIGQISYKQCAEIYNSYHEYECDQTPEKK